LVHRKPFSEQLSAVSFQPSAFSEQQRPTAKSC
jgi:hypothetical protein